MSEAAECARVVLWAAGLCAVGLGGSLLARLPRDGEGVDTGLATGVAFGAFAAAVWLAAGMCGVR